MVAQRLQQTSAMRSVQTHGDLRLPALLHSVQCAVIELDLRGHIRGFNPEAERLHHCREGEVLGAPYLSLFVPREYRDGVVREVERVINGRAAVGVEYPIVGRDGVRRDVLWNLTVVDPGMSPALLLAVGHDVTESRRRDRRLTLLEDCIRQNNEQADLGIVAAEIVRTVGEPLTGLGLRAAKLARKAQSTERDQPVADVVNELLELERGISSLATIIRRFKTNSRELVTKRSTVDLCTGLIELTSGWLRACVERRVSLELNVSASFTIVGNIDQLRRAYDHLLRNAFDAIGEGPGGITIRATRRGSSVRVAIADTGRGLSPVIAPFALFHTDKPVGAGIGLNVARRIIEDHGGTIGYEPILPTGTVFYFDLPLAPSGRPHREDTH